MLLMLFKKFKSFFGRVDLYFFCQKCVFCHIFVIIQIRQNPLHMSSNSSLSGYEHVARWFSEGLLRKCRTEMTSIFFAVEFVRSDFNFFRAQVFLVILAPIFC